MISGQKENMDQEKRQPNANAIKCFLLTTQNIQSCLPFAAYCLLPAITGQILAVTRQYIHQPQHCCLVAEEDHRIQTLTMRLRSSKICLVLRWPIFRHRSHFDIPDLVYFFLAKNGLKTSRPPLGLNTSLKLSSFLVGAR